MQCINVPFAWKCHVKCCWHCSVDLTMLCVFELQKVCWAVTKLQLLHGCLWECHVRSIRLAAESNHCLSLLPVLLCFALQQSPSGFHPLTPALCPSLLSASALWVLSPSGFYPLAGTPMKACSTSLVHSSVASAVLVMIFWLGL